MIFLFFAIILFCIISYYNSRRRKQKNENYYELENPDKYIKEYNNLLTQIRDDYREIESSHTLNWMIENTKNKSLEFSWGLKRICYDGSVKTFDDTLLLKECSKINKVLFNVKDASFYPHESIAFLIILQKCVGRSYEDKCCSKQFFSTIPNVYSNEFLEYWKNTHPNAPKNQLSDWLKLLIHYKKSIEKYYTSQKILHDIAIDCFVDEKINSSNITVESLAKAINPTLWKNYLRAKNGKKILEDKSKQN